MSDIEIMQLSFLQMGFGATVTASSPTPTTDGYVGTFGEMPYHIHPAATPDAYAALAIAIAANEVTVKPYIAPVIAPLTLAQQAIVAMSAGLVLTSTSTPSLNGTYDVSGPSQNHISAEMLALLNSGGTAFADGTSTVVWPDMNGENHTFNTTQAKAFFLAVGMYVAALFKCQNGTLTALPSASATIA